MKAYFGSKHFQMVHTFKQVWNRYRFLIFYIAGLLLGIVIIILFHRTSDSGTAPQNSLLVSDFNIFDDTYRKAISTGSFRHMSLWKNVMVVRFRDFAILLILGFARYHEMWISAFLSLEGVIAGMYFEIAFLSMGNSGILLFLSSVFPHFIIYIAAVILMIKFFHKKEYHLKNTAAIMFIIMMILLLGTFLESFVNPYIQKWMLYQLRNFI